MFFSEFHVCLSFIFKCPLKHCLILPITLAGHISQNLKARCPFQGLNKQRFSEQPTLYSDEEPVCFQMELILENYTSPLLGVGILYG